MSVSTQPALAEPRPTTSDRAPGGPADSICDQVIGILPWADQLPDDQSHDPRSAYVETFWLPVVGPSATLLMRRLADAFDESPEGFEVDLLSLSREIGLGPRMDKGGAFARTIERCVKFNMMYRDGAMLYACRRIPRLGERGIQRLNDRLQALHRSWTIDAADDGAQRRTELVRATHLARTLLALGEPGHEAERQLHRWHFHPSIAWHAVQWAQTDPDQLA